MADESFFREVNEELRHDRAKAFVQNYGLWVIAAALLVVLLTAGVTFYQYWTTSRADKSGDDFSQALMLANTGRTEEALAAFDRLEKNGYGAYPLLARLRAATVLVDKGDFDGAVKAFDAVANDGSIPAAIRDVARLRAALVLVDHGSYADVASRVEPLTAETNPLRHSAHEVLGLAAWKAGKTADALKLFEQVAGDPTAPEGVRQRATMMSELIHGSGAAAS